MNRALKIIPGIMCAGILLVSCEGSEKNTSGGDGAVPVVELEGYHYDAIAQLPDSLAVPVEGGEYMRMKGQGMLPVKINGRDVAQLRDSLEKIASVIVLSRTASEPRIGNGYKIAAISADSVSACGFYGNQLSVSLCTPQLIVWKDYSSGYICHAAHGTYSTSFINYSIEKGKILQLGDIMATGYEKELLSLIRKKIADAKVDLTVDIDEVGMPSEFEVTSNGLNFLYGIYEIAPYSEGEVSVDFQSYELVDLFAPGAMELLYGPETE